MSSNNFYHAGGPPDPIQYLRRISTDATTERREDIRRTDSADDFAGLVAEVEKMDQDEAAATATANAEADAKRERSFSSSSLANKGGTKRTKRHQDPPARERPAEGQPWPYRDTLSFTRSLMFYGTGSVSDEHESACQHIAESRSFRQKYQGSGGTKIDKSNLSRDDLTFRFGNDGVVEIFAKGADAAGNDNGNFIEGNDGSTPSLVQVPNIEEYHKDYTRLVQVVNQGAMRSFCFQRLQMLSATFKMHTTMNGGVELKEQSNLLGTDFYRTLKIDNHIHAAAAPSAKQFVEFVRTKLETEGDTVVTKEGKTLQQVFDDAGLDKDHLTIDAFDVLADYSVYQRFDNFNSKYSPFRMAAMRRIFLKTSNHINGRYFAELLKIVLNRHETSKGHNSGCEMRLSIYGMEDHEWTDLADWMMHDWGGDFPGPMVSSHNRWIIQIPRLWRIYSKKPGVDDKSFIDMLKNIFNPLFEATLHPEAHPKLAEALKHIVGFDSVDDEGSHEDTCSCQRPQQWRTKENPSYWWQLYYLWANLEVLNTLRAARGMNTFAFRPHAGETGDPMHLACTYMLCASINHGINLDMQVSLQYLYYLDQVGLSISPLSNNFLFRKIGENPFPKFFRRGMNVTLSTDDPLLFHMSDDALLEEYSVARASFDLSMTDMMELARNSVRQSGFEESFKKKWLGKDYWKGVTFCDEHITHVPLVRAKFRAEHLAIEHMLVHLIAAGKGQKVLEQMKVQFGLARDAHRNVLFDNFDQVPSFPEQGQL